MRKTFVLLPATLALVRPRFAVNLLVPDQSILGFEGLSTFATAVFSVVGVDVSSVLLQGVVCIESAPTELADKSFFVLVHSSVSHNSAALAVFKVAEFTLEPARTQLHCDILRICFLLLGLRLLRAIVALEECLAFVTLETNDAGEVLILPGSLTFVVA